MTAWQWHQLDHMQIICILIQTGNHASTSSLNLLEAGSSSRHSTNSVNELKKTQTTDPIRKNDPHTSSFPTSNTVETLTEGPCTLVFQCQYSHIELECGPMPNVMATLPNIGGALCSMPQSFIDVHY